ncbi:MAG TPA: hypothetical protein PLT25_12635, partial [Acidocella sp.]
MKLIIYSYLSEKRSLMGDIPVYEEVFSIFNPPPERDDFSVLNGQGPRSWGPIACQYYALQNASNFDYIGFENAARPMFIDILETVRLRESYPDIFALREKFARDWNRSRFDITAAVLKDYEATRVAFNDADKARLARWIERADIVVPQVGNGRADRFRLVHLDPTWDDFVAIARNTGIFQRIPEHFFTIDFWPWHNSFIMRADLFAAFADAAFTSFFEFRIKFPGLNQYAIRFLFEKLLGVYLRYTSYANALFRKTEVPLLHVVPKSQPTAVPEGFNVENYMGINADVAASGGSAEGHFMNN